MWPSGRSSVRRPSRTGVKCSTGVQRIRGEHERAAVRLDLIEMLDVEQAVFDKRVRGESFARALEEERRHVREDVLARAAPCREHRQQMRRQAARARADLENTERDRCCREVPDEDIERRGRLAVQEL